MNRQDTVKLLSILSSVWSDETVDDRKITAYLWAFEPFPYEAVEQAARLHMQRSRFFPKPAELLELMAEQVPTITTGEAWELVLRQVRRHGTVGFADVTFDDPAIMAAVKSVGWRRICLDDDSKGYVRRDFDEALATAQRRLKLDIQGGATALPDRRLTALPRVS